MWLLIVKAVAWIASVCTFLGKGLDWLANKAQAIFIGSKFWGLALSLSITAVLVGLFMRFLDWLLLFVTGLLVSDVLNIDQDVLDFLSSCGVVHVLNILKTALSVYWTYVLFRFGFDSTRFLFVIMKMVRNGFRL